MPNSSPTAATEATKATTLPKLPLPNAQLPPESELDSATSFGQRAVHSAGGSSPQTPPGRYSALPGQIGHAPSQRGSALRQLQQGYGNQYVGRVIQAKLTVGEPGDIYEQEADRVAAQIMRMPEDGAGLGVTVSEQIQPLQIQRLCKTCEEEEEDRIHRKAAGGAAPAVTPAVESRLNSTRGGGQPLPEPVRAQMEPRFGADFSGVRVHTGDEAAALNRDLKAQAFTRQRDIYFGSGKYNPEAPLGQRLLAHELTHVVQQSQTIQPLIQRQNGDGQGSVQDGASDDLGGSAGPCEVDVRALTNAGLLFQLNRARVYLTQHIWGEDETYDYANLLRRASHERRQRIYSGHVWMAEPGLLQPPEVLYGLRAADSSIVRVEQINGNSVAGRNPDTEYQSIVTPDQFQSFLILQGIFTVNASEYFAQQDLSNSSPLSVTLSPRPRTVEVPTDPDRYYHYLFSRSLPGLAQPDPFSSILNPTQQTPFTYDPFGINPLGGDMQRIQVIPSSGSILNELNSRPGSVSSSGPERVFLPRSSSSSPSTSIDAPWAGVPSTMGMGPDGVGGLGFLGRPNFLPEGTTGVLWEGSHVSDVAVLHGRTVARGFRAPFRVHAAAGIPGSIGQRATASLNVGRPGSYANDSLFPLLGEAWGHHPISPRHWTQGSVLIVPENITPGSSSALIERMGQGVSEFQGQEYRFSPPPEPVPPGPQATQREIERYRRLREVWAAAHAEAQRRGLPQFCPGGAQMCVNAPIEIHQQALGGTDLTFTRADGTVVNLADPAQATAANMSEFMNQPDSFYAERGLRRVRVGPRVLAGVGVAGGLGVGGSIASDAYRIYSGEDISYGEIATHAGISGVSSIGGAIAEDFVHTGLTTRLASAGLSGSTASLSSRLTASTGVAVIIAPVTRVAEMYFDDRHYTDIDYYAGAARSGVSAAGGALASAGGAALATGVYFSVAGSPVPVVGNAIGFVVGAGVGFVGYYVTDALVGDEVEEGIRVGLGERGCTD